MQNSKNFCFRIFGDGLFHLHSEVNIPGHQDQSKAWYAYKLQIRVESSGEGEFQRKSDRGCKDLKQEAVSRREAVSDQDNGVNEGKEKQIRKMFRVV